MEKNPAQGCPTPTVLVECWRANDGTFALVVVNHGEDEVKLDVDVDLSDPGHEGSGRVVRVNRTVAALTVDVVPM